jgi:hypothetical protein
MNYQPDFRESRSLHRAIAATALAALKQTLAEKLLRSMYPRDENAMKIVRSAAVGAHRPASLMNS